MNNGLGFSVDIEYKDGDVAVLNSGEVRYIFEVLNTHRTTTNCRPEPLV